MPKAPTAIEFQPFPADVASVRLILTEDVSPARARASEVQARAHVDGKHKEFVVPARHRTIQMAIQAAIAVGVVGLFYPQIIAAMQQGATSANYSAIYLALVAIGLPSAGSAVTEIIKAIRQQPSQ